MRQFKFKFESQYKEEKTTELKNRFDSRKK